jgi:hypothetical protein
MWQNLKPSSSKGMPLLLVATIVLCAIAAVAQNSKDKCRPASVIPFANEPPAKIVIDPPLAEPLARGVAIIQYCAENLRFIPVFGPNALAVSPRVGHLHVRVDDAPWVWAETSGNPIILMGLPPGPHKVLIELEDANHHALDKGIVTFVIPEKSAAHASGQGDGEAAPIFGVKIPAGYRDSRLISVAREEGNLNDLRAILGNKSRSKPTGKGTIRSRRGPSSPGSPGVMPRWRKAKKHSAATNHSWPGHPRTEFSLWPRTQEYATAVGWGFGHFNDGKPADEAVHKSYISCHETVKARDFVFNRYAP